MKPPAIALPRHTHQAILLLILILGLFLRMNGIEWGLPNELHPGFSYLQDEIFLLGWADMLAKGTVIPSHFIYGGTFYFAILQAIIWIGTRLTGEIGGNEIFTIILLGRLSGVIFALLTLYLVYALGKMLFSPTTGLVAALILAVVPAHVFWAQRVRPDELFALQFTLNFLMMARIFKGEGKVSLNLILGGLFLGIATATRFPGGVLIFGYVAALVLNTRHAPGTASPVTLLRRFLVLAGAGAIGYFLASPHSLINFPVLLSGLQAQWHYQGTVFENAINRGPIWYQYGGRVLSQALGYPLYILMLIAIISALWKRRNRDLLLLAMILPYFLLLAKTSWVVTRYTVPLMPAISLLIAALLLELAGNARSRRVIVTLLTTGVLFWTTATDLAYANVLKTPDPRDLAALWIAEKAEPDATIGAFIEFEADLCTHPPRISKHPWAYFNLKHGNIAQFFELAPDYMVVNMTKLEDAERLGTAYPNPTYHQLVSWTREHPGYSLVQTFSSQVAFAGLDMGSMFTTVDYMLARPKIAIYKKDPLASAAESKLNEPGSPVAPEVPAER